MPQRFAAVLVVSAVAGIAAAAHASGVATALGVTSPAVGMRARDVQDAQAALARASLGLSAALDVTPALAYSSRADAASESSRLEPSLDARLRARYRLDGAAIAAARLELALTEEALAAERRDAITSALQAQVRELRSVLALQAAEASLAEAQAALRAAQADALPLSEGELRDLVLERDLAATAVERAEVDLGLDREALAQLMVPTLTAVPTDRFALPAVAIEGVPRVRLAALRLDREQELGLRDSVFGVLEDVHVTAGYAGTDAATFAEVSVDRGRPAVGVDLRYRNASTDRWLVGVQATLHVDDTTLLGFTTAARAVADAEAALEDARDNARARLASARLRAQRAREDVDAAARAVDDTRFRLGELRDAHERAIRDAAEPRDAERAQREVARRQALLAKQQDRWARSWSAYVTAVARFLDEAGGAWEME